MKRFPLLFLVIFFLFSCSEQNSKKREKKSNIYYDKAFVYKEHNQIDSAVLFFNKAKEVFLQQKDSLGVGKCLLNMAIFSTENGDSYGGQELSLNAIEYFDIRNNDHHIYIQSNFNNLGLASEQLARYPEAISFYQKALPYSSNNFAALTVKNNIANVYRRVKNYNKSLAIYKDILKQDLDSIGFARTLSNLTFTKWLQDPSYKAAPDLLKALKIRQNNNDLQGIHASYAHLSDYYADKNTDSTLIYANKMYQVAKILKKPFDQIQSLQKLIRFGPTNRTKQYFERYRELDDSIQIAHSNSRNQFAVIRYETEKKEADNLVLQKDNADKKYQIIKREILLYSSLFVLLTAATITIIWYKKRRQKIELETQNAIRENQLKTSKKVHDVVANGLYRVMTEIENQPEIDKENLLDKIEYMYERSRDISYEEPTINRSGFAERIIGLVNSFVSANVVIKLTGNTSNLWQKVNEKTRYEIEHILQELMVNMDKHSKADLVTLQFEQEAKQIHIYYTDNGIGFVKNTKFKNGLSSTGNRIKNIFGTITFEQQNERGLEIHISFPVS